jgi:hypothetical protein
LRNDLRCRTLQNRVDRRHTAKLRRDRQQRGESGEGGHCGHREHDDGEQDLDEGVARFISTAGCRRGVA